VVDALHRVRFAGTGGTLRSKPLISEIVVGRGARHAGCQAIAGVAQRNCHGSLYVCGVLERPTGCAAVHMLDWVIPPDCASLAWPIPDIAVGGEESQDAGAPQARGTHCAAPTENHDRSGVRNRSVLGRHRLAGLSERQRNNTTWTDICRSVVAGPTFGNFGTRRYPWKEAVMMKKGTGHMLKKYSMLIKRAVGFSWFP